VSGGLDALHAEIRAHAGCGFDICAAAKHIVPGEGSPRAAVMFVGEAPGASEDEHGRPFVGRAGRLLDELLAEAGLTRAEAFITNVVKARPPGNRDPTAAEIAHHMPWLERQLEFVAPRVIVTLGRHALGHFVPGRKISEVHGQLLQAGDRRVVPWLHPAAALRNPRWRETLFEDARALPALLVA
jgi:DNA polymerase